MIKIKSNLKRMLLLAPGNSASIKITYSEERSHDMLFCCPMVYTTHNFTSGQTLFIPEKFLFHDFLLPDLKPSSSPLHFTLQGPRSTLLISNERDFVYTVSF